MRMELQKDRVLGFGLVYGTMTRFLVDAYSEEELPLDEASLMAAYILLAESLGDDVDGFISELKQLLADNIFPAEGEVMLLPSNDGYHSVGYVLAMLGENAFHYDEDLYNELKRKIDEGYSTFQPSTDDLCRSLINDVCPDGDLALLRKRIKDLRVGG